MAYAKSASTKLEVLETMGARWEEQKSAPHCFWEVTVSYKHADLFFGPTSRQSGQCSACPVDSLRACSLAVWVSPRSGGLGDFGTSKGSRESAVRFGFPFRVTQTFPFGHARLSFSRDFWVGHFGVMGIVERSEPLARLHANRLLVHVV